MPTRWSLPYSRLAVHLTLPGTRMRRVLPGPARAAIEEHIEAGAGRHTGLVRVVIESSLSSENLRAGLGARERALKVFSDLAVWDTEDNNGVLLYVLLADRAVEIVADRAAARRIERSRWQTVCEHLSERYHEARFLDGTLVAIDEIHELLAEAFPAGAAQRPEDGGSGPRETGA